MEYKLDIKENALDSFNEALAKEGANKSPNIKMRLCKYLNLIN
ncbi:hypothetical protein KAM472_24220 [Aeromonas caviae]|jgi:hypothetical protein|nr:hypothetical protein KAM466_20600 [Aeromonas caviae]GKR18715.1 hypothetical protein KAM467_17590 [Aeromonas caviae]GKR23397.1 hypothetical protein KAM468_21370 [Aeromonas caviae]GKR28685.1 hypothetical protein KAM469_31440 [Aeromonas caviae]GKR32957.1 hypothetical protein KAM470_30300 [Aeromonas caviae]